MRCYLLLGALALLFALLSHPAGAGVLFPPQDPMATGCQLGTVLIWNPGKGEVDCSPPLSNISITCPQGQAMVCFSGDPQNPKANHESCLQVPTCIASQTLNFVNNAFTCQDLTFPSCPPNTSLQYANGKYVCQPLALPVCTAGQYLTSLDGATFVCSQLDTCQPNWTNISTGSCSATCGGGVAVITQSDGCGHAQTVEQSCNTQSCPPPVDAILDAAAVLANTAWSFPGIQYNFTINMWVKIGSSYPSGMIWGSPSSGTDGFYWTLNADGSMSGQMRNVFNKVTRYGNNTSPAGGLKLNSWNQIAFSYGNGGTGNLGLNINFYINGVLQAQNTSGSSSSNSNNLGNNQYSVSTNAASMGISYAKYDAIFGQTLQASHFTNPDGTPNY